MRITIEPSHGSVPSSRPMAYADYLRNRASLTNPWNLSSKAVVRVPVAPERERLLPAIADPNGYSSDGRYILYTVFNGEANFTTLAYCRSQATVSSFLFATRSNRTWGRFTSPDVQLGDLHLRPNLARAEIPRFRLFHAWAKDTGVRVAGGARAGWRRDRREPILAHRQPGEMIAVPIQSTSPGLKVSAPALTSRTTASTDNQPAGITANYDVTAHSYKRFIVRVHGELLNS